MKIRKCRTCGKDYFVPSLYPGCCSEICKIKRNSTMMIKRKNRKDIQGDLKRWYQLRYKAFRKYGNKCLVCGSNNNLNVDHIKPRKTHPHLIWDINNLQILCAPCNQGKGARYGDDWR